MRYLLFWVYSGRGNISLSLAIYEINKSDQHVAHFVQCSNCRFSVKTQDLYREEQKDERNNDKVNFIIIMIFYFLYRMLAVKYLSIVNKKLGTSYRHLSRFL